jgi:hypothetical protein
MPYESGLLGYAAFTSLALAMTKHARGLGWNTLPPRLVLKILGWALLALSATVAVIRLGPSLGVTTWIGQICVAASLLVMLLSWRPRLAAVLAGAAIICACCLMLF